jgi:hypothetical protein
VPKLCIFLFFLSSLALAQIELLLVVGLAFSLADHVPCLFSSFFMSFAMVLDRRRDRGNADSAITVIEFDLTAFRRASPFSAAFDFVP